MVAAGIDFASRFSPLLRLRLPLDFGALARFFLALDYPRDCALHCAVEGPVAFQLADDGVNQRRVGSGARPRFSRLR